MTDLLPEPLVLLCPACGRQHIALEDALAERLPRGSWARSPDRLYMLDEHASNPSQVATIPPPPVFGGMGPLVVAFNDRDIKPVKFGQP